jgi:PAS domain S-box-containing protein
LAINKSITIWSLCGVSLVLVSVRLLLHKGLQRLAIWLYIGIYFIIVGAVITQSGGAFSTDAFYFVPLVAIAGLLLDALEGLLIVACIFLYLGFLWWLNERALTLFSSGFVLADVLLCCVITLITVRLAIRSLFGSLITLGDELVRRQAVEKQLVDGKAHLNAIYEALSDLVLLVDSADGTILEANHSMEHLLGRSGEKLHGQKISHLFSCEPTLVPNLIQTGLSSGQCSVESEVSTQLGRKLWLEIVCTRISQESDQRVVLVLRDITVRKQRDEEKLWYERIVNQMRDDVVYTDPKGQILFVNPNFERSVGYTMAECVGKPSSMLKSGVHNQAFYKGLWSTITAGNTWFGILVNRTKAGLLINQETIISPIIGQDGGILGYLAIKRDITGKLELEKRYIQAQKMEAIGTLAGGIAHDFNNILTGINGFTSLALQTASGNSEQLDYLGEIRRAGHRAAELVRQILAFSRAGEQAMMPMQLRHVVSEATKLLRASIPSSIEFEVNLAVDLPAIQGNATQLHQVVMNLGTNAWHAMRDRPGKLSVRLETIEVDESTALALPGISPGPHLRLAVSDTGCGMDITTQGRAFEPFFTTKGPREGTGLGLSVVHGIIGKHHGAIKLISEINKGTTFEIYLPATSDAPIKIEDDSEESPLGHGERILVVDDEESLVRLGVRALCKLGYAAEGQSNVLEALARLEREPHAFQLVITDQTMPGMNGLEFAQRLGDLRADLPVLLASGVSDSIAQERIVEAGVSGVLSKPYSVANLALLVSKHVATKSILSKFRILLIEDDPRWRRALSITLKKSGYEVFETSDGREGLVAFKSQPIDLVVTDIVMEKMDGIEIICELRKLNSGIPIIVMSGGGHLAQDQYLHIAELCGAAKIFSKPIDPATICAAIGMLLVKR